MKTSTTPQKPKAPSKRGGARPGSGRKPAHVEADLAGLMDVAWPLADRIAAVKALHQKALMGSVSATIALLDRALGKPIERVAVDRKADDALKIRIEYAEPDLTPDE